MRQKLTFFDKKEHQWSMQYVKAISIELQRALVVADIDEKKIWNAVRKICIERRKISLLRDVKMRK